MRSKIKAVSLEIPGQGDPDRKRALNVLAQRRYRQRKREKIKMLERKVKDAEQLSRDNMVTLTPLEESNEVVVGGGDDQDGGGWTSTNVSVHAQMEGHSAAMFLDDEVFIDSLLDPANDETATLSFPPSIATDLVHNSTTSFLCSNPLTPTSLQQPTPSFSTESTSPSIPLEEELQSLETTQHTFPDSTHLYIPELAVLRAGLNIATLLGIASKIWDPTHLHVFPLTSLPAHIPPNLQPTPAQLLIPHHPLIDIFPWPSVRTRLITVLSQPKELRPEGVRDEICEVIARLMVDLDDGREGVRVWCGRGGRGGMMGAAEELDEGNWEVGDVVYRNWWWCLDREVVENSNRLRRERGVGRLRLR